MVVIISYTDLVRVNIKSHLKPFKRFLVTSAVINPWINPGVFERSIIFEPF